MEFSSHRKFVVAVLLSSLCTITNNSFAQELDNELSLSSLLELKVVSASKRPQKLSDAPATMYVITKDDIRKYGFQDLKEAIKVVPGMEVSDSQFFLFGGQRGFANNFSQTLVMINGREVQNLLAAESFISNQFRLHNVQRIEVIQGPASALYGANAFSGVINLITDTEDKSFEGAHIEASFGTWNTKNVGASFARKLGDNVRIAGHANSYYSDGEDFTDFIKNEDEYWIGNSGINSGKFPVPGSSDKYKFANPSSSHVGGVKIDIGKVYAGVEFFENTSAGGLEDPVRVNPTRNDIRKLYTTFAGYSTEVGKATYSIEVNRTEEDIESRFMNEWQRTTTDANGVETVEQLDGPVSGGNFWVKGSNRTRVIPQANYDLSDNGSKVLIVGASYESLNLGMISCCGPNNLTPTADPKDVSNASFSKPELLHQKKVGLFAQYQHGFNEQLTLTVGGRYDDHSVYGSVFNPRSGLVYKPENIGTFKLLYGQAFREPNVFEINNNGDLPPAKMRTLEVSYQTTIGKNLTSQVVLFQNMAELASTNSTGATETSDKDSQGAEATFNYQFGSLRGQLNASYVDVTKNEALPAANDEELNNGLAATKVNLLGGYDFASGFTSALVARGLSKVTVNGLDKSGAVEDKEIAPSMVFDANFSQKFALDATAKATIGLSVKSLADTDYYNANVRQSSPYQFKQNGRAFYVNASADF